MLAFHVCVVAISPPYVELSLTYCCYSPLVLAPPQEFSELKPQYLPEEAAVDDGDDDTPPAPSSSADDDDSVVVMDPRPRGSKRGGRKSAEEAGPPPKKRCTLSVHITEEERLLADSAAADRLDDRILVEQAVEADTVIDSGNIRRRPRARGQGNKCP